MSKFKDWDDSELMYLGFLIQSGYTNPEIAKILNRPQTGINIKSLRIYGGNPNYKIRKTKHKHLHESLLRYFVNHTALESQEKFNLTSSEFKSCMSCAYLDKKLSHIRKDTRTKRPWELRDYLTLLRWSGLKPRKWIAKKLKRGGLEGIRDRLGKLNISSKNIQGLTLSQFRLIFNCEPKRFVKTSAGPTRGVHGASFFKIVLWTDLDLWLKQGLIFAPDIFKIHISSMAIFQKWVWENYDVYCK